jgi:chaperone required for assembly of F1-ATPase
MQAARSAMRPQLPRRFYKTAGIREVSEGFALALDGKLARTPAKTLLAVPHRRLAQALSAEWNGQGERIDPSTMPLTRIVNSTLDGVSRAMAAVAAEIVQYSGSDLLCYRAREPDILVRREHEAWDAPLAWAADALGASFRLASGIIHIEQSPAALDAIGRALAAYDAFGLAALHVMTTLTGSAVLALAVARGRLEPEAAWAAAHVDEDYQIELWGADGEGQRRRAMRWSEMEAAARILALCQGPHEAAPTRPVL